MEDFQVIDHCLMIRMPSEVDHHLSQYLCKKADAFLTQQEVKNVVFDFEDTQFMDSSGVGIIMGRYRKVHCLGGRIYVIHAGEQIRRIIRVSGMTEYVNIIEEKKEEESVG